MVESNSKLTSSAVENALLHGLYIEADMEQQEIHYHSAVSFFPENTRMQKIKARLKRNHFIYGCWLKLKKMRDGRVARSSLGVMMKSNIKKNKIYRYMSNKMHMPMRIVSNNDKLTSLLDITTAISLKVDSLCWGMEDLRNRVVKLEEVHDMLGEFETDFRRIHDEIQNIKEKDYDSFRRIHDEIQNIKEKDYDSLLNIQTIIEEPSNSLVNMRHELNTLIDENRSYLTSLHEKLDNANETIGRIKGTLNSCKTVINSNNATCVQYDWGLLLGVPSSDWRLAAYLSLGGHFEYGTEVLFRKTVKPGMTVLDVGANVGIYTLHALKAGANVYSFEPTPTTFDILKHNTALNGFENSPYVHLFNCAVSNREGIAKFAVVDGVCGQNNMFAIEDKNCIEVQTVSLDHTLKNCSVDCFKLDVEGAEILALQGMKNILSASDKICGFVEFAPQNLRRANVEPKDFFDLLKEYGFEKISLINENSGEITPVLSYEEIENVFSVNLFIEKG